MTLIDKFTPNHHTYLSRLRDRKQNEMRGKREEMEINLLLFCFPPATLTLFNRHSHRRRVLENQRTTFEQHSTTTSDCDSFNLFHFPPLIWLVMLSSETVFGNKNVVELSRVYVSIMCSYSMRKSRWIPPWATFLPLPSDAPQNVKIGNRRQLNVKEVN